MKDITSTTGSRLAVSAATTSVILALFVPYGHPWASLAWAVMACAIAVATGRVATRLTARVSDVIGEIEAEPLVRPDLRGGVAPTMVTS